MERLDEFLDKKTNDQEIKDKIIYIFGQMNRKDIYIDFFIAHFNTIDVLTNDNWKIPKLTSAFQHHTYTQDNDLLVRAIGYLSNQYDFDTSDGSGIFRAHESKVDSIVDQLKSNGFYIFEDLLDNDFCDSILNAASELEFGPKYLSRTKIVKGIDLNNHTSSTYWIKNLYDVAKIPNVQKLLTDSTLLKIAQKYIESVPINSQTNLWYSVAGKNDTSQRFHQDCEDPKFLKVFIYLSDVSADNGPHTYVKSSKYNIKVPSSYKICHRIDEKEITKNYPSENILSFTGKKGTIILEDTNGFHKGSELKSGHRIILQLEFCSTIHCLACGTPNKEQIVFTEGSDFQQKYPMVYIKYN